MPKSVRRKPVRTTVVNRFPDEVMVTSVEPRSSSVGYVGVGDKIFAINHNKLKTVKDLNKQLAKPEKESRVTLKRSSYSCCKRKITTVETLTVEKGSALKVIRTIEIYMVQIRLELLPDMDLNEELGLSVQYDNKEQLQVAKVVPGSLASVHLRPGDIISTFGDTERLKRQTSITKSYLSSTYVPFLNFYVGSKVGKNATDLRGRREASVSILRKVEEPIKTIRILIEAGVEADGHIEMPEDVQHIAQKQLALLRSMKSPNLEPCLRKKSNPTGTKHIAISKDEYNELGICSDYDETALKHVRKDKKDE